MNGFNNLKIIPFELIEPHIYSGKVSSLFMIYFPNSYESALNGWVPDNLK